METQRLFGAFQLFQLLEIVELGITRPIGATMSAGTAPKQKKHKAGAVPAGEPTRRSPRLNAPMEVEEQPITEELPARAPVMLEGDWRAELLSPRLPTALGMGGLGLSVTDDGDINRERSDQ